MNIYIMKGPIRRMSLPFQKGNILLSEYLWETRSLKDYFEDINNNYCQYEIQLQTTFSVASRCPSLYKPSAAGRAEVHFTHLQITIPCSAVDINFYFILSYLTKIINNKNKN